MKATFFVLNTIAFFPIVFGSGCIIYTLSKFLLYTCPIVPRGSSMIVSNCADNLLPAGAILFGMPLIFIGAVLLVVLHYLKKKFVR